MKLCLFFIGVGCIVFTSFKSNFKSDNDHRESMSCWISIQYIECLKNKLPCDCEKESLPYFTLLVDTSSKSKNFGFYSLGSNQMEFYQWDIREKSKFLFEISKDFSDSESLIGLIKFERDRLYFIDRNGSKSIFRKFGSENNQSSNSEYVFEKMTQYRKENIILLNRSLKRRKLIRIEEMVETDSLICDCSKELGGINLIGNNKGAWILEQKRDSLFLYDFVNSREDKTESRIIRKKLLKKYKWQ